MSAIQIKRLVGDSIWQQYYKFCFECNPWDRAISLYYWRLRKSADKISISEFIQSEILMNLRLKGLDLYMIDDCLGVDEVYQFENLHGGLRKATQHFKNSQDIDIDLLINNVPRAKSSTRIDQRHYSEILTPFDVEAIAQKFSREIDLFKY